MKIIERYIMRRTLAVFAATLLWVLAIVWTTQVLTRIDVVTTSGQSARTFFEIAMLVLPAVIPVVIPFALGIAVAQTLTAMNTDSEMIVLSAAGSPRSTIIRPVLIIAVLASITSFAVNNFVEPHSRERMRNIMSAANAELISSVIQEGRFERLEEGLYMQISERLPDGRFAGIFLADRREDDTEMLYFAKSGAAVELGDQQILVMQDGVVHHRTQGRDVSVVRYQSYALDLAEFSDAGDGPTLYSKDRTIGYLLNPDAEDRTAQRRPQLYRAEVHRRFSEWLYPLVIALIGLAVAGDSRSFREARIHPLITTMFIALLVRWAGYFASNQNETSAAFTPVVYAVPFLGVVIPSWFIATNRTMELPTGATEKLIAARRALGQRALTLRYGGRAGASGGPVGGAP